MWIIYPLMLIASFILGVWDNGDITVFVLYLTVGILFGLSDLYENFKRFKNEKRIVIKPKRGN